MVAITKLLSGLRPCMFSELVVSEIAYKIKLNDHLGVSNNTIINILLLQAIKVIIHTKDTRKKT